MLQDGAGRDGIIVVGWMDRTGWGRNGVLAAQCSSVFCSLGL